MSYTRALLATAFVLVAGCDAATAPDPDPDPSPGPVTAGRFAATVTGSVSGSFQGTARLIPSIGGAQLSLIGDGGSSYRIYFSSLTATGTPYTFTTRVHTVATSSGSGLMDASFWAASAADAIYQATSGSLTVTESSADHAKGTFDFTAIADPPSANRQVRVQGQLHAVR